MKKFLMSLALLPSLLMPVKSEEFTPPPFSYRAMSCMKMHVCTEGIEQVDIDEWAGETYDLLVQLKIAGVEVYIAESIYFPEEYRAVYYSDTNVIYMNRMYAHKSEDFLLYLRHEGWHVVQDCMGGSVATTQLLSLYEPIVIPREVTLQTIEMYGNDPETIRIEREAVWASQVPDMTLEAMKVCNSPTPMWEEFEPPNVTRSWLYVNGFVRYNGEEQN